MGKQIITEVHLGIFTENSRSDVSVTYDFSKLSYSCIIVSSLFRT
jgi:hypothetical protein